MGQIPKVVDKVCEECLFSEGRIVSGGVAAQIIKECQETGQWFVCHKAFIALKGDTSIACRSFYETIPNQALQIAERLGLLKTVSLDYLNGLIKGGYTAQGRGQEEAEE